MINIYTTDSNKNFKEIEKPKKGCWIDLINPTEEEVNKIAVSTNTDEDLLLKLLDSEELPRVEKAKPPH